MVRTVRLMIAAFVLLAGVAAFAQQSSQTTASERPGVIEGIVVNQLTGEPVRRAEVRAMPMFQSGGSGQIGNQIGATITPAVGAMSTSGGMMGGVVGPMGDRGRVAATDQSGAFRLDSLQPGDYIVVVQRTGFVTPPRNLQNRMRSGVIKVGEGETVTGVKLTLLPQAVLAGRVVDEEGEPMQGVMVSVVSSRQRGARGRGGMMMMRPGGPGGGNTTNDLGEFRITGVSPGKALLVVQPRSLMGRLAFDQSGEESLNYTPTYYPGVTDPSQAQALDIKPGAELTNLDFKLRRVPVFRVRGRAFDADGAPLQRFAVTATVAGQTQMMPAGASSGGRQDGSFEITNLAAGDYTIRVTAFGRGPAGGPGAGGPGGPPRGSAPNVGVAQIAVSNRNIDGFVVQVQPGIDVTGVAVVQADGTKPALTGLRILMTSAEAGGRAAAVQEDGSFTVNGLTPGKYLLSTSTPASGLYLASVRMNEQEMFGKEIDLSGGAVGPIQLVFRADGGSVTGNVDTSELANLASPATAVLLPVDEGLRDAIPARTAQASSTGTFQWADIRPGEYFLWVFDSYDPNEIADPDFVRTLESSAVKVRVTTGQGTSQRARLTQWPSPY